MDCIVRDRFPRDHADRDLGGAGVESGSEGLAAMVSDTDQRAGKDAVGGDDVRAVDPDVSGLKAGSAARGDFHGGKTRGKLRHAAILNAGSLCDGARVVLRPSHTKMEHK